MAVVTALIEIKAFLVQGKTHELLMMLTGATILIS